MPFPPDLRAMKIAAMIARIPREGENHPARRVPSRYRRLFPGIGQTAPSTAKANQRARGRTL
jgi:hypothetical protein